MRLAFFFCIQPIAGRFEQASGRQQSLEFYGGLVPTRQEAVYLEGETLITNIGCPPIKAPLLGVPHNSRHPAIMGACITGTRNRCRLWAPNWHLLLTGDGVLFSYTIRLQCQHAWCYNIIMLM